MVPRLDPRGFATVAGFGLVHGLGFGRGLLQRGLPVGRQVEAIASFTVGLELTQLVLVLLVVLLLRLAESSLGARFRVGASLGIAALGLAWFGLRVA